MCVTICGDLPDERVRATATEFGEIYRKVGVQIADDFSNRL